MSCNDTTEESSSVVSHSSEEPQLQIQLDTIALPPILKNSFSAGSYHDSAKGDLVIFKDMNTSVLSVYSISEKKVLDTINIPSPQIKSAIPYYQDVRQYMYWHNQDTLVFMDDRNGGERHQVLLGYSIPNDSIFLRIPFGDLSNPKLGELFGKASNYMLVNWQNPSMLIAPYTDFSLFDTAPLQSLVLGRYYSKDSSVQVLEDMQFPFLEKDHDYSFLTEYYMVYNPIDNAYVTASSLTPNMNLYKLDEQGKVSASKTVRPLSRHYQNLPPPPRMIDGKLDYDQLEETEITAYAGHKLFHNPHLNIYFRFFEKPQPLERRKGHYSSYQNKEFGLMILNKELNLLGELLLGAGAIQFPNSARIVSNGIAYTTRINQDNREMIIVSLHD